MKSVKNALSNIIGSKYFNFIVTVTLFVILYVVGMVAFPTFSKPQVFLNLFVDNAALIVVTVGLTFVLLTGGIDISVASVVALTCMMTAHMLENMGMSVPVVIVIVLLMGIVFGLVQGYLITYFNMQPFIVTLAGQFFARGMTAIISQETVNITNPAYMAIAQYKIRFAEKISITVGVVVAIVVLIIATLVLKYTKFGRRVYAVGGSEQSAGLMGLNTKRTKLTVYVISSFCAALGGIVFSWSMLSGYTLHALGMEMEAISSSVIGGTLLTGGVAFMPGALFGVLIQAVIQTLINFQGTLSAWWTKIVIAVLLCVFIVMQTLILKSKNKAKAKNAA